MKKSIGVIALLAGILLLPAGSWAEDEKEYQLESMTVTAQKTGEDVQDIPMSVSAFSDVDLEEKNVEGFQDLVGYVPNMFIRRNSTDNAIVIRGVSSFASSLYSTTGFYVDGVNYPIHQMQDMDFLDIERVEVLKGPQGTLYGGNSQSGVVNIITKEPGNEYSGKVFADVGAWDANGGKMIFKEGFSANLPFVKDVFRVRVAAQKEDSDGWMKNTYDDDNALGVDHIGGRLTGLWTPREDLDVTFIVEGRSKNDGVGVYRFTDGPYATGRNKLDWNGGNRNSVDADAEMIKVEYSAESVDITSVTARHSYYQDFVNDMDMSPISYGPAWENSGSKYDVDVYSEEFRVASVREEGSRFDWLTGVYGYKETIDTDFFGYGKHDTDQDNWGAAGFGQGTWNITSDWHLTMGARLDYVHLDGKKHLDLTAEGEGLRELKGSINSTEVLPSLSLSYDIGEDVMSYAKVSRGYLAGGFDYATSVNDDQFMYDPEYSWNYELGMKSNFLDKRLTANIAAFFIDITDKQVAELLPTMANPDNRRIVNAAKAESYGAELELQYKPVAGLLLNASVGYLNSRLRDWKTTGSDPYDYDGKKTPGSPDWTYTVGGIYRWESGFLVGADLTGVSSYYTDTKNFSKVDGRALVNTRIGYEGDSFDVIFWTKNLFDEDYYENEWDWGGTSTLVQQGEPRSLGIRLTYYF